MPARLVFRCEVCDAEPDDETHRSLTEQVQDACTEHRIALRDFIRKHYGTLGWHPHVRVLGDVPPQVRDELAGAHTNRRASARQRRLRGEGGFPLI